MIFGLVFDLASFVNLLLAVLAGGAVAFLISKYYAQLTNREVASMLRTVALTLEQRGLAEFRRTASGEIDLLTPASITGKLAAVLPRLKVTGEGTIEPTH